MTKRVGLLSFILIGATIVAIGLGVEPAQAIPFENNGNHNGWYKENGQSGQNFQYNENGQNGNNGNHTGWYKESGQSTQLIQFSSNVNTLSQTSVPEPASLTLLGAGLAGIGIWRRMNRKA